MVRIEHEPNDDPVAGEGFEPPKVTRLIYSQMHLAALQTCHARCFLQPRADNEITSSTPYRVKL